MLRNRCRSHGRPSAALMLAALVSFDAGAGCGPSPQSTASLTGMVSVRGAALPGVAVMIAEVPDKPGYSAEVVDDGIYTIHHVTPGTYRVWLSSDSPNRLPGAAGPNAQLLKAIPPEFLDPTKTPLMVTVRRGENRFPIRIAE